MKISKHTIIKTRKILEKLDDTWEFNLCELEAKADRLSIKEIKYLMKIFSKYQLCFFDNIHLQMLFRKDYKYEKKI